MGAPPNPAKGGIPSWQKSEAKSQPTESSSEQQVETVNPGPLNSTSERENSDQPDAQNNTRESDLTARSSLVARAKTFLEDPDIKAAPAQQKRVFLESKGLDRETISTLDLNSGFDSTAEAPPPPPPMSEADTTSSLLPTRQGPAQSPQQVPTKDIPPIITYPEHLFPQAAKQPPLVTTQSLLNTAYTAAGVTAVLYGLSRYLVDPMKDTLASARREFAAHVQSSVSNLNTRLQQQATVDPRDGPAGAPATSTSTTNDGEEAASEDSDPTELFHRDFGTQTSSSLLESRKDPDTDPASSSPSAPTASEAPSDPTVAQSATLTSLKTLCASLNAEHDAEGETHKQAQTATKVVTEELENLAFPTAPPLELDGLYGESFGLGATGTGRAGGAAAAEKKAEDEVARLSAEIRGFKGMLLSARRFPAGGSGAVAAAAASRRGATAA